MFSSELTPKAEQTRSRIKDAAIASFIERGYPDTTIRLIAAEAGVSVGNAYYYFPSKTHLVQELYEQVQSDHARIAVPRLEGVTGLVDRLRVVFETGLANLEPYRKVAPGFLSAMIAPDSPINPLSRESSPARDQTVGLLRRAIDGADHRVPEDIASRMPDALFVLYLGLVLRWTYDDSADHLRTRRLLDTALRLFAVALPFLRMPGIRGVTRDLLDQIAEVRA
ncbi:MULTISPECIES: TetR/AcrR family transcriptional regulator [unclassified Microbacterium]|uniref:TetR/AcrR family transcriptional regulator n=1 Tax=unclassified Microbacterium TaxID=2609290 RepID=UPI0012F794FA|nr:TetR family transcriptional regulator [Microbacterium sp. MAH-37]MVQ42979.1 TetR family transcriptional regulator [Microbacterium sp. MAH-37]